MSAKTPILFNLNLSKMSKILAIRVGPEYRHSFNEGPLTLHEASNTARILVVYLSLRITDLCGR